jgi:hypothetical protein
LQDYPLYGSEKAPWIHEITDAFNRQGEKTASGKAICVHATSPASDLYDGYSTGFYAEKMPSTRTPLEEHEERPPGQARPGPPPGSRG